MDDALAEHLRITAQKGVSREEIQQLLLQAGWPADKVKIYIDKTFKKLEQGVIIRVHGLSKKF